MTSIPYSEEWRRPLLSLLSQAFGVEYLAYYELQVDHWGAQAPEAMRLCLDEEGSTLLAYLLVADYLEIGSEDLYAYLYCVCTLESRRGEGIMGRLLRYEADRLCQMGYCGLTLIPSSVELKGYYAGVGFGPVETPIYTHEPVGSALPLLCPGQVAKGYLKSLPPADPDYPTHTDSYGNTLLSPPAGWMLYPLIHRIQTPALVQPLT